MIMLTAMLLVLSTFLAMMLAAAFFTSTSAVVATLLLLYARIVHAQALAGIADLLGDGNEAGDLLIAELL